MTRGNTLYGSIENNEVSTPYENCAKVEEEEGETENESQYIETDSNEQLPFHQGIHRSKRNQILGIIKVCLLWSFVLNLIFI